MAGTTGAPGNIPLFDDDSDFAPIQSPFNAIAAALNTALAVFQAQTYLRYATRAAMDAVPGTAYGQHATVDADPTASNNGDYVWSGSVWVAVNRILGIDTASPNQLLTTTSAAITGLSVTATLAAAPIRVKADIQFENTNSGADRFVLAQIWDGSTALGVEREIKAPYAASVGLITPLPLIYSYTPTAGSHTFTVKARATDASAVTVRDCDIEITTLR